MKSANTIYSGASGFALFSSLSSNTPHVMAKNHYTFADLKPLFFDGASTSKLLCDGIDSAQSIFSLRWVLSHFYMYLDQAETDFLCEVGLSLDAHDLYFRVIKAANLARYSLQDQSRIILEEIKLKLGSEFMNKPAFQFSKNYGVSGVNVEADLGILI